MEKIKEFKLEDVPLTNIMFVATSPDDYSMERLMIVEDWPDYGKLTVVEGGHCSCYGFDETQWDAITYTTAEFSKVVPNWLNGTDIERMIATLWTMSGRS